MSDDQMFGPEEGFESQEDEAKSGGFLPDIVMKILKFVALGLGAVVFIVTVVVITVSILNQGNQQQSFPVVSPEYEAKPPVLEWYKGIGEIRGRTADSPPKSVMAEVYLGYEVNNKQLNSELIQRAPRFNDMIRSYFAEKSEDELLYEEKVKLELKERINRILTSGKIEEVIFGAGGFNIFEF